MTENRYLASNIAKDLTKQMVFLAGPRQVGKTTLARTLLGAEDLYLNWDNRDDRKTIISAKWPVHRSIVVLDELHKYRRWKGWLKGEHDTHGSAIHFLVTGSARLDTYRSGGDSLQGRYHHYRLHPFSVAELLGRRLTAEPFTELDFSSRGDQLLVERLVARSGFPVPYFAESDDEIRRWRKERLDRFFREDVRDLENVRDMSLLENMAELLTERVGSILSLNALREDLEVSHRAVTHWTEILDRLYYSFRIAPFSGNRKTSLRRDKKLYLWDYALVQNPGARFENMIASHLLKFCHFLEDTRGFRSGLFMLRDREQREVDFVVTIDKKPWFQVEAKLKPDDNITQLRYFQDAYKIPFSFQVSLENHVGHRNGNIQHLSAARFLSALV